MPAPFPAASCSISTSRPGARPGDLKVFGYINMCRAYYALMKERGSGVIINVTGNAAQTHDPEYICGVTGNAALTAFSQSLAASACATASE